MSANLLVHRSNISRQGKSAEMLQGKKESSRCQMAEAFGDENYRVSITFVVSST
jgi:hypothetical protein